MASCLGLLVTVYLGGLLVTVYLGGLLVTVYLGGLLATLPWWSVGTLVVCS